MDITSFSILGFLALSVLAFCLTPRRRRSRDILPSGKHFQSKRHATALPPRGYVLLGFSLVFYAFAGWKKLIFLLLIALLLVVEHSQVTHGSIRDRVATLKLPVRWAVWYGLLAGILILGIYGPGYSASSFAYMNF